MKLEKKFAPLKRGDKLLLGKQIAEVTSVIGDDVAKRHSKQRRKLGRPAPVRPTGVGGCSTSPPTIADWRTPSANWESLPVHRLVPAASEIPLEIQRGTSAWMKLAQEAFFDPRTTLLELRLKPEFCKSERECTYTLLTLQRVLSSCDYLHDVKIRQVATLLELWCDP